MAVRGLCFKCHRPVAELTAGGRVRRYCLDCRKDTTAPAAVLPSEQLEAVGSVGPDGSALSEGVDKAGAALNGRRALPSFLCDRLYGGWARGEAEEFWATCRPPRDVMEVRLELGGGPGLRLVNLPADEEPPSDVRRRGTDTKCRCATPMRQLIWVHFEVPLEYWCLKCGRQTHDVPVDRRFARNVAA